MSTSTSKQALESLSLQHQYHLKQQSWVQERERRSERIHEQKAQKRENSISQGTQTEPAIPVDFDYQPLGPNESHSSLDQTDGPRHKHSITETDTLLAFHNRHKQSSFGRSPPVDEVALSSPSSESSSEASSKSPKNDKILTEEMRVQNEDLRKHVRLLVSEIDELKRKNQSLQSAIEQQETSKTLGVEEYSNMDTETLKLTSLELPPLELPEFDFSSLKDDDLVTD